MGFMEMDIDINKKIVTSSKMTKEMTPVIVMELSLNSLSRRTREAQTSMAQLKVRHQKSSNDWQHVVQSIREARKNLDELKTKQDFFELECKKKSMRGSLELDNFETNPETWKKNKK